MRLAHPIGVWLPILVGVAALAAACGDDDRTGTSPGSDMGMDGGSALDGGPPMACETEADCDDGIACTLDGCGVGGVCRHDRLDERCAEGEICSPREGCTVGCASDADCQDGAFCNGPERCIGGDCFMGTAADCNDNNACTVDSCSNEINGCVYDTAEGCDAGLPPDAGIPVEDFDPEAHYEGRFVIAPAPSLGCPPATYAFGEIALSRTADTLTVTADRFTLTQSPVPAGPGFDVSGTDGSCPSVRLMGTFSNSNQLEATWTAMCGICGNQSRTVFGERVE